MKEEFYDVRKLKDENLNFIIRDSKIQKCDFIIFNKYLQIPEKEVKRFKHNYIDDILTIYLQDESIIVISNFKQHDFEKIEYKKLIGDDKIENN